MPVNSIPQGNRYLFTGTSADTKPTTAVQPGSLFTETDTLNQYIFGSDGIWHRYYDQAQLLDSAGYPIVSAGGALYTAMFIWQPSTLSYIHASADTNGYLLVNGGISSNVVAVTANQGTPAGLGSAWPVKLTDGTNVTTVLSLTNSKPATVAIVDSSGNQITSFGGGTQYAQGTTQATPTGTVALGKNPSNVLNSISLDASNNLLVNVASGSITATNPAAGLTGSAVPANASYTAWNSAGNLTGISLAAPLPVQPGTGSTFPVSGTVTVVQSNAANLLANVTVTNFPATQTVSGSVSLAAGTNTIGNVSNILNPVTVVSNNAANFLANVTVTNFPSTQVVTQSNAANLNATVTGTIAATQSGTWTTGRTWTLSNTTDTVNVGNFPASQTVSGSVSLAAGTNTIGNVSNILNAVTVSQSNASNLLATVSGTVTAAQSNAANLLVTVIQSNAANHFATVVQSNASNLNATVTGSVSLAAGTNTVGNVSNILNAVTVTQSNASNLLATVSGTVTAAQSNAANLQVTVVQSNAANHFATVVQSNAANLNATVTGSVSIAAGTNTVGNISNILNSVTVVSANASNLLASVSGTVTSNQGTAAATASAWPVKLTDGTNVTSVLSLTNSKPAAVAIVDGTGTQITSFGGGTQYTQGASNTAPVGTVAMGKTSGNVINALAIDASSNLLVNVAAGSVTIGAGSNAIGSVVIGAGTNTVGNVSNILNPVTVVSANASNFLANVTVTNFPASQVVTQSNASNLLATVSGSVSIAAGTNTVGNVSNILNPVTVVSANASNFLANVTVTNFPASQVVTQSNASNLLATVSGSVALAAGTNAVGNVVATQSNAANLLVTAVQSNAANLLVTVVQSNAANLNTTVTGTVTATQSNAANLLVTVVQSNAANLLTTVTPPTLTKGTQGTTGFSVQNLKDAGRAYVSLLVDQATGVTTEALATVTANNNGTTSSGTQYTVTTGKTFVLQAITATVRATLAHSVYGRVRVRVAATVANTSPVVVNLDIPTVTGLGESVTMAVPDGIFIAAAQQIGITQIVNDANSTVSVNVIGYEF